jgi:hypothetical protein
VCKVSKRVLHSLFYKPIGNVCVVNLAWIVVLLRFNYRSTAYMVKNGIYNFLNWFDERAWYPLGRIVGGTVYPGLMVTSGSIHYVLHNLNIPVHIRDICVFLAPIFRYAKCFYLHIPVSRFSACAMGNRGNIYLNHLALLRWHPACCYSNIYMTANPCCCIVLILDHLCVHV